MPLFGHTLNGIVVVNLPEKHPAGNLFYRCLSYPHIKLRLTVLKILSDTFCNRSSFQIRNSYHILKPGVI